MANLVRSTFLHELTQRYGILKKLPNSDSLFDWSLKPEDFNKWRQENDLPFLLDFFKNELPHFCDWMKEQSVTDEDFIKAPHTGEWFLGKNVRQFLTYLEKDQPRFVISEQFDPHYSSFASQQSANTLLFEPYKEFEIQESIFRVFVRLFPLGLWRETI